MLKNETRTTVINQARDHMEPARTTRPRQPKTDFEATEFFTIDDTHSLSFTTATTFYIIYIYIYWYWTSKFEREKFTIFFFFFMR